MKKKEEVTTTKIDHPSHYNKGKIEVIDVIEDWNCGFNDGNAIKYIARYRFKENKVEDLKKAIWYIDRILSKLPNQDLQEARSYLEDLLKEQ